ncbi:Ig-like domain-containing protein [Deinococcus aestuarii]|uniref:Ig-like domain-containing protein n=1 Tax=Deinococcus aestuarii TaxID=2774531 RepID=UPI001C0E12D3|nr:Ig-like domain-containing protein [Deinococcus aestuarii]
MSTFGAENPVGRRPVQSRAAQNDGGARGGVAGKSPDHVGAPGSLPTFESNHHVTLEADASDPDGRVSRVEFFINGTKIGEDDTAPYRFVDTQERDSSIQGEEVDASFARAVDDRGAATTSAPERAALRSRDYSGGSLLPLRAINLGGPATAQDNFVCSSCPNAVFYEAGGAGDVRTNGTPLPLAPGVAPVPRVLSPEREDLIRSALSRPGGLEVSVPVPSAPYDVYLWVRAEDAAPYDIEMEGRRVARFDPGEAGRWDRLGPFRLTVEDGALDVASLGAATASFSGLELWRVARPGETPPTVTFDPRPGPGATAGQALPLSVTASAPTERVALLPVESGLQDRGGHGGPLPDRVAKPARRPVHRHRRGAGQHRPLRVAVLVRLHDRRGRARSLKLVSPPRPGSGQPDTLHGWEDPPQPCQPQQPPGAQQQDVEGHPQPPEGTAARLGPPQGPRRDVGAPVAPQVDAQDHAQRQHGEEEGQQGGGEEGGVHHRGLRFPGRGREGWARARLPPG